MRLINLLDLQANESIHSFVNIIYCQMVLSFVIYLKSNEHFVHRNNIQLNSVLRIEVKIFYSIASN